MRGGTSKMEGGDPWPSCMWPELRQQWKVLPKWPRIKQKGKLLWGGRGERDKRSFIHIALAWLGKAS